MAYIIISTGVDDGSMTLQERVLPADLDSEFFCTQLVERLRWAVGDAHATARADPLKRRLAGAASRAAPTSAASGVAG